MISGDFIIYAIILTSIFVSYNCFRNRLLFMRLEFSPYKIRRTNEYYRFLTYGFVHVDWTHLLINMFVLYSFGTSVVFMSDYYFRNTELFILGLYFGGLVTSTLFSFFRHRNNYHYAAVGASGAVSAMVFTSILLYPVGSIRLFLIPFDIPAYIFGFLYLIYSAVMAKRAKDNVGHDAHFFGAVYGFIYPIVFKPDLLNEFLRLIF
jgi:membrane associated rhomboid family serine protease